MARRHIDVSVWTGAGWRKEDLELLMTLGLMVAWGMALALLDALLLSR